MSVDNLKGHGRHHWDDSPAGVAKIHMTAGQYSTALGELAITHREAAKLFGIMRRQSRDMAKGTMRVPGPVARLLSVMFVYGISPADVLAIAARVGEEVAPPAQEPPYNPEEDEHAGQCSMCNGVRACIGVCKDENDGD